jgi:hypothetical protein
VRKFFKIIPSSILASWKEVHLNAVNEKMYVCRYLPAVKPLVASNESYLTLRAGGGVLNLEDIVSLLIPI